MIKKMIGYRIKELRINSANMTQEEFAKALSWDRSYLSRVESGKQNITIESLGLVCDVLKVSLKEFFEFMDDEHIDSGASI